MMLVTSNFIRAWEGVHVKLLKLHVYRYLLAYECFNAGFVKVNEWHTTLSFPDEKAGPCWPLSRGVCCDQRALFAERVSPALTVKLVGLGGRLSQRCARRGTDFPRKQQVCRGLLAVRLAGIKVSSCSL